MPEEELRRQAELLRRLHHGPEPLVLPNAWDAASARLVADTGFPVVATSSAAVAASLGVADGDVMGPDVAFAAISRIARVVSVPVTADVEAGYGLRGAELVDRLLAARAVGCNLEDTDHHGPNELVGLSVQAGRIEAVCRASEASGVAIAVNARVDVFVRRVGPPEHRVAEAMRRGQAYLAAGATCVYPIGVTDEDDIRAIVEGMGGPINIWLRPDTPPLARLREIGVARISLASGLQRATSRSVRRILEALKVGDTTPFTSPDG